ncbi:MAG: hypothetical protein JOZ68_12970 [Acidimicrobiia bacterium]|nr:hypothetical protein [Acidimicrobiia bacterium]MBV9041913.1 hypothetical protein [Acidimicrobiia bacterium]
MADVAFVTIIIVFFALAALFVRFCDRVIGSEEDAFADAPESTGNEQGQLAA